MVAITGENEFPRPCLILDVVKTENFVKTVAENLKNEKCVSVKKNIEEFKNLIQNKM